MKPTAALAGVAFAAGLALASGCAAPAVNAVEPSSAGAPPPEREVAALEDSLSRDEARLYDELATIKRPTSTVAVPAPPPDAPDGPTSPATTPKPQAKPTGPRAVEKTQAEEQQPATPSACAVPCKALESMRRSARKICELAGSGHPRCERANERVVSATTRVRAAGCRCS